MRANVLNVIIPEIYQHSAAVVLSVLELEGCMIIAVSKSRGGGSYLGFGVWLGEHIHVQYCIPFGIRPRKKRFRAIYL